MRAKKRVVTYGKATPYSRGASGGPAPSMRRTPTVRTIRSAIVEPRPGSPQRQPPTAVAPPVAGEVADTYFP